MTPEIQIVSQYGAIGFIVLALIGLGKWGNGVSKIVLERFFVMCDRIEKSYELYHQGMSDERVSAERRHAETRQFIADMTLRVEDSIRTETGKCRGESPTKPIGKVTHHLLDVKPRRPVIDASSED